MAHARCGVIYAYVLCLLHTQLERGKLQRLEEQFVGGIHLVNTWRKLIHDGRLVKVRCLLLALGCAHHFTLISCDSVANDCIQVCRRFDKTYHFHLLTDVILYSEVSGFVASGCTVLSWRVSHCYPLASNFSGMLAASRTIPTPSDTEAYGYRCRGPD